MQDWLWVLIELCNSSKHDSINQLLECDASIADPSLTGLAALRSCVKLLVPHRRLWPWSFEAVAGSVDGSKQLLKDLINGKIIDAKTSRLNSTLTKPLQVRIWMLNIALVMTLVFA